LAAVFTIVPVFESTITSALALRWKDFEEVKKRCQAPFCVANTSRNCLLVKQQTAPGTFFEEIAQAIPSAWYQTKCRGLGL
jgi:hypothetical protein